MGVISNGTTLLDAGALDSGIATGAMTLIKTLTASSSGTLSFVNGASGVVIDGTYKEYVFKIINIHPSASASFLVGFRDGGSNYDATKTTTYFRAYHQENAGGGVLAYDAGFDLAQSTDFQDLTADSVITDNDSGISGTLQLFFPSSTTFVKHFKANINSIKAGSSPEMKNSFSSGYCNVTAAIDAVQFKMGSGNMDSGTIKLYGIK